MALKFYLNNQEVKIETNATFIATMDDSLDTGSFTLEWNSIQKAIAPMTPFRVENTDTNDIWNFVVIQDKVSVVKKTPPMLYSHELIVMQNTQRLTKHILRNTTFSQPVSKLQKAHYSFIGYNRDDYEDRNKVLTNRYPILPEEYEPGTTRLKTRTGGYYSAIGFNKKNIVSKATIKVNVDTSVYISSVWSGTTRTYTLQNKDRIEHNLHLLIPLIIEKYYNDQLVNSLEIEIVNGATNIEIDNLDFFNNGEEVDTIKISLNESKIDELSLANPTENNYSIHSISSFNIELDLETYYYSLYDVLDIISKQAKKEYNGLVKDSIYTMPSRESEQGKVLESIVAPEFKFTQSDLFSCVSEVLQYIDAVPTMDENNVIGFEYLNDYGQLQQNLQATDLNNQINEEYYSNRLISLYQNAKQNEPISYPSKNTFARLGSGQYGIPTIEDYQFNLPKPIDYLDSVVVKTNSTLFNFNLYIYTDFFVSLEVGNRGFKPTYIRAERFFDHYENIELIQGIFEKSEYSLLKWENADDSFPNQLNTLYYEKNSNSIYFGAITDTNGLRTKSGVWMETLKNVFRFVFGIPSDLRVEKEGFSWNTNYIVNYVNSMSLSNLQLQVTYHAIYDGKVSVESIENKYDGETFTTQSNANVQLNRMGVNMQGLIARLGNESKTISLDVSSYGSRMKKGSLWVDDDGNKYIANRVKTTFSVSSNRCITEVEFVKNFNMLSQFVKLDQERRFYEISQELTSKGYETINEFIYITTDVNEIDKNKVSLVLDSIVSIVFGTLLDSRQTYKANFSTVGPYKNDSDTTLIDLSIPNETNSQCSVIYIPMHNYGFGNSLCFEMNYENSINAGDRLTGGGISTNPFLNKTTLYTDKDGFADMFNFVIFSDKHVVSRYLGDNFPLVESNYRANLTQLIFLEKFKYYKKPNEILHLNYEISFLPTPNKEIFIGEKFINDNAILSESSSNLKELYLYISQNDTDRYSIIDKKALGTLSGKITEFVPIFPIGGRDVGIEIGIIFTIPTKMNGVAWCIADSEKNIILSCNEQVSISDSTLRLYFFTRHNRI